MIRRIVIAALKIVVAGMGIALCLVIFPLSLLNVFLRFAYVTLDEIG